MMAKKADEQYYPFACVEEVSIHIVAGIIETTTVGSGQWDEFEYSKRKGWEANLRGVATLEDNLDNCWTQPQVYEAIDGFAKLDLKLFFIDLANRLVTYTCTALLVDLGISATVGDGGEMARWDLKLKGSGPLVAGIVEDKTAYVLNEQGGTQLLEGDNGGALVMG